MAGIGAIASFNRTSAWESVSDYRGASRSRRAEQASQTAASAALSNTTTQNAKSDQNAQSAQQIRNTASALYTNRETKIPTEKDLDKTSEHVAKMRIRYPRQSTRAAMAQKLQAAARNGRTTASTTMGDAFNTKAKGAQSADAQNAGNPAIQNPGEGELQLLSQQQSQGRSQGLDLLSDEQNLSNSSLNAQDPSRDVLNSQDFANRMLDLREPPQNAPRDLPQDVAQDRPLPDTPPQAQDQPLDLSRSLEQSQQASNNPLQAQQMANNPSQQAQDLDLSNELAGLQDDNADIDKDQSVQGNEAAAQSAMDQDQSILPGEKDAEEDAVNGVKDAKSPAELAEESECKTCEERKYQDGSDDPGVSYKLPTKISADEAPAAVRSHEQEHVVRERAEAQREGRKVVSQSVTIHTAICPECGKVYVSGGTTRTVTAADPKHQESNDSVSSLADHLKDKLGAWEGDRNFHKAASWLTGESPDSGENGSLWNASQNAAQSVTPAQNANNTNGQSGNGRQSETYWFEAA